MRGALLILALVVAGAVLVPASVADSPARARAQASVVAGPLGDFGTVTARAALRVTLGAARGELPAGTTVDVAVADASARDQVVTATPTPTPTATSTPKPEAKPKAKAKRRKAPKV